MPSPFVPPIASHRITTLAVASVVMLGTLAAACGATLPFASATMPGREDAPTSPAASDPAPLAPRETGGQPGPQPAHVPIRAAASPTLAPPQIRREVAYSGPESPGTIVVDTRRRLLFLVEPNGRALRYEVGVGRPGRIWTGRVEIGRKVAWPRWVPTAAMMRRDPSHYGPLAGGVAPGPTNPLGVRALYLFRDGADTLYRIHGTADTRSIGRGASSGCIRMLNQDVVDLFARVPVGATVVVTDGTADQPRSARAE